MGGCRGGREWEDASKEEEQESVSNSGNRRVACMKR